MELTVSYFEAWSLWFLSMCALCTPGPTHWAAFELLVNAPVSAPLPIIGALELHMYITAPGFLHGFWELNSSH